MLTESCRRATALVAAVLVATMTSVAVGLLPAAADGLCPPGSTWMGWGCTPDEPPDDPDNDDRGTGCNQTEPTVVNAPCAVAGSTFSPSHDRYLRVLDPQPTTGDPRRDGHPMGVGAVYEWRKLSGIAGNGSVVWGAYGFLWLAEPPDLPGIDPEAVAEEILLGMDLRPVAIGVTPRPGPGSVGLVGMPNWTWVEDPSPNTWGPLSDSDSAGGVTVTVTAHVDDVTWAMGDGTAHACTIPGTPYQESAGITHSPDCGGQHVYESLGDFTVTATSNWSAAWTASTGDSGTLSVPPLSSSVAISISELQVVGQ